MSLRLLHPLVLVAVASPCAFAQDLAGAEQFVQAHCVDCHGGDTVKGKLDLGQPAANATDAAWRWARLRDRVRSGEMPPPDAERPSAAAAASFVQAFEAHLRVEFPKLPVDPGSFNVRCLCRSQLDI